MDLMIAAVAGSSDVQFLYTCGFLSKEERDVYFQAAELVQKKLSAFDIGCILEKNNLNTCSFDEFAFADSFQDVFKLYTLSTLNPRGYKIDLNEGLNPENWYYPKDPKNSEMIMLDKILNIYHGLEHKGKAPKVLMDALVRHLYQERMNDLYAMGEKREKPSCIRIKGMSYFLQTLVQPLLDYSPKEKMMITSRLLKAVSRNLERSQEDPEWGAYLKNWFDKCVKRYTDEVPEHIAKAPLWMFNPKRGNDRKKE